MARIKVQCDVISKTVRGYDLWFKPAEGDHSEHKDVFNAGATGLMRFDGVSAEVAGKFEPGVFYYLDFTPLT